MHSVIHYEGVGKLIGWPYQNVPRNILAGLLIITCRNKTLIIVKYAEDLLFLSAALIGEVNKLFKGQLICFNSHSFQFISHHRLF